MDWNIFSGDRINVGGAAARVTCSVGINQNSILTRSRQTQAMVLAHHWRKVSNANNFLSCRRRAPNERHDILRGVVRVDPLKAGGITIYFPQRRGLVIGAVEIAN